MKRVAIYARCSTPDQRLDLQNDDLRRFAEARGLEIVEVFEDQGVSGAKTSRPGLDRLMDSARKHRFDAVLVWKFDRFARSSRHLITALEEFRELGIQFISYTENIDTASPMGQALFTIVSAMAQLERSLTVERVRAGMAAARKRGRRIGRPKAKVDLDLVHKLRAEGKSLRETAILAGVSEATMSRLLRAPHVV